MNLTQGKSLATCRGVTQKSKAEEGSQKGLGRSCRLPELITF